MNYKTVLEFAVNVGERMLANGCGTHRIEGLINKVLNSCNISNYEVLVTTTGIVVTINPPNTDILTMVKKVPKKKMHTENIFQIESLVNAFVNGTISAKDALKELENTKITTYYPYWVTILAFGLSGCFRTIMFGGKPSDGICSIICGILMGIFIQQLNKKDIFTFLVNCCGGFVVGFIARLFTHLGIGTTLDTIILGTIMPIAPGVPFVHAVNDILHGDYNSGTTRAYEAILTAFAITSGIYFASLVCKLIGGSAI